MADNYKQYTSCCQAKDWVSLSAYLGFAAAGLAVVWIPIIALAGWCALFYLLVAAAAAGVAACRWWLEVRLVCLGGDRSAIGMLVSSEPPADKSWPGSVDSDFSMNLLPYPALPGVTQADLELTSPYGVLVAEQAGPNSMSGSSPGRRQRRRTASRVRSCMPSSKVPACVTSSSPSRVALGLAIAALIACVAIPPPWGLIVAGILALLAFLAALFGTLFGSGDHGAPGDVKGAPTEVHDNDPVTGLGADLLYVYGTWVFDSLHTGWNEIHPIKKCTFVGKWDGAWPTDIVDVQHRLDAGFADARDPATVSRQAEDRFTWAIHPLVDGCGEAVDVPAPTPAGAGLH